MQSRAPSSGAAEGGEDVSTTGRRPHGRGERDGILINRRGGGEGSVGSSPQGLARKGGARRTRQWEGRAMGLVSGRGWGRRAGKHQQGNGCNSSAGPLLVASGPREPSCVMDGRGDEGEMGERAWEPVMMCRYVACWDLGRCANVRLLSAFLPLVRLCEMPGSRPGSRGLGACPWERTRSVAARARIVANSRRRQGRGRDEPTREQRSSGAGWWFCQIVRGWEGGNAPS